MFVLRTCCNFSRCHPSI